MFNEYILSEILLNFSQHVLSFSRTWVLFKNTKNKGNFISRSLCMNERTMMPTQYINRLKKRVNYVNGFLCNKENRSMSTEPVDTVLCLSIFFKTEHYFLVGQLMTKL